MIKISIALTTYNGAPYLQDQLDSYLSQERLPDEIIICDDVSTDATIVILEKFKQNAPFEVQIIKNLNNLGFTKNFEKALSECTGDLIFLSDQDDIWYPGKIRVIEDSFQENPHKYLVIHDGDLVDGNLESHGTTKRGQVISGYGTDDSLITGALTAVRWELMTYVLPIPDGIIGHDVWLHNIASILNKRLVLNQSLQLIRRHSSNTSAWVANSVTPINKIAVAKKQLSSKPASSYDDRLLYNVNLSKRLHDISLFDCSQTSIHAIYSNLEYLITEHKAIINREKLINLGFVGKKIKALKMLFYGDYAYFNGIKSFMRDFIR